MRKRGKILLSGILILVALVSFLSLYFVLAKTEPFTIEEKTEYDLIENTVYLTITENLGKDQTIYLSNIFNENSLTEKIDYNSILMYQSYEADVYGSYNESLGKYSVKDQVCEILNETNICTDHYYDDKGNEMYCDFILEDKTCLKLTYGIIGTETRYDYRQIPNLKEKEIFQNKKIERKFEGILLPKNSEIKLKLKYKHPIAYGMTPSPEINKYDIKVASMNGLDESILDPNWWNGSWSRKREIKIQENSGSILYNYSVKLNITHNESMQPDFDDLRFTNSSEKPSSELGYWIEEKYNSDHAIVWVKVPELIANVNTSIYIYYNNSAVSNKSNKLEALLFVDEFNDDHMSSYWTLRGTWDMNSGGNGLLRQTSTAASDNQVAGTGGYWNSTLNGFEIIARYSSPDNDYMWRSVGMTDANTRTAYHNFAMSHWAYGNRGDCIPTIADEGGACVSPTAVGDANWHTDKLQIIIKNSTTINWTGYMDGSFRVAREGATNKLELDASKQIWIGTDWSALNVDWVQVRAYAYLEPTYTISKYEEFYDTAPPGTSILVITPSEPKTADNLECYATLTDDKQTNLIAFWEWYKNNIANLSGSTSVINGTYSLITTLSAGNTSKGQNWTCEITPFDGSNYGNVSNSTPVTILNTPPNQTNPLLSTPSGKNFSYENLTCYNKSTYDADNDIITNIYNWYKNSQPLAVLNMPFEINADDYSGYGNDGTLKPNITDGPQFINGKVGKALSFDGVDDYVFIADSNSLDFINKKSWEIWFKRANFNTLQMLFAKKNEGTNYKLALKPDNKLEFSYFIPPGPASFVLVTNTKTKFDSGNYSQTRWNGSAVTLNWTFEEKQIFFDGFESGNLTTKGWLTSGPGTPWFIETADSYAGTYHAEAGGTNGESILSVNISTENYENITYSFYWDTDLLDPDPPPEYLAADYYNGTNWKNLLTNNSNPTIYILFNITLSSDANNNPNFAIRFRCLSSLGTEECKIDNVEVRGTSLVEKNYSFNGNYTSEIFDAGNISEWKNFSWTKTLPIDTNLTFQLRSCNDAICVGEIFVGPDNTTNTSFSNSVFNDISFIVDNRWFQYKAYFSTTNIKKSPGLYSVSVNYIKNITDGLITLTSSSAINDTNWHHAVVTFDNTILTDNFNLYLDSILETSKTEHKLPVDFNNNLYIGKRYPENDSFFNGVIDEVKIYNKALTAEQVRQRYEETKDGLTSSSRIVEQETSAGDKWMCQVTPNDAEVDGLTLNSSTLSINWAITFDVRDSYSDISLNDVTISCNYSDFNQAGDYTNPYGPYGFPPGNWECNFTPLAGYYDKIQTFSADSDKTINVKLSEKLSLTVEEHTWLEWLYNCFKDGECRALLENINKTTTQIWQRLTGTDTSVITQEKVLSYELSSTSNISINYTVKVPYKEGIPVNELLPIRLYFWFTDPARTKCYSQDKATDTNRAESPYCLPLVAETLGPNNGTVTFRVDLRPALAAGTYNFTRSIEIDPLGIWTQYGREDLGSIEVLDSGDADIEISNENRINFESSGTTLNEQATSQDTETETTQSSKPGITGAVIGSVSGWHMVAITGIIAGLFLALIICQTVLRIKKK